MEITRQRLDDTFELKVKGRLDAYWAGHLSNEVAEVLRDGARSIRLNMKEVEYVSSAGIRVLFQTYKQLNEIRGTFAVSEPSEAVQSVLELAGMAELLFEKAPSGDVQAAAPAQAETLVRGNARFEILESRSGQMTGRLIGSPELLSGCQFHKEHCQELPFGQEALGIGLGAFGKNFADCQSRFGEFLAAAGVAAYLPTDGSNVPDYILSTGDFVPRLQVLYGLSCQGDFSKIVYFESRDSLPLTLREIVEACREIAGSDAIAVAMKDLRDRVKQLNLGLEDRLGNIIGSLSGGQRQALTLLMATWLKPKLLLLDEHTAALDPKSADQVIKLTDEIVSREKLTTLMVTHSMHQGANLGDRLIMMHRGRVIHDFRGADKRRLRVNDLLARFDEVRRADQLDETAAETLRRAYV